MSQSSAPNPPKVAVVTVSYGSEDVLGPFLESLSEASVFPLSIVVADNKPRGNTTTEEITSRIEGLAKDFGAHYLPMSSNRGYGHAINQAVKILAPEIEWVVVSNPDVIAGLGAIDLLVDTLCSDQNIAAVGPRILTNSGEIYPSARSIPSLSGGIGHALFSHVWPANPWTRNYRRDAVASPTQRDAGWLSGAFLVVRRTVLERLHGFDEDYFMYFEDVDLGYRISKIGLRSVYEPAAVVTHTGAHSTSIEAGSMLSAHHRSAKRFVSKQYPGMLLWPVRRLLGAGLDMRSWLFERKSH
ncbi:glycosyltransferase family 2 protein [Cryobacterium ruanii]|uniref:Glycosyltransferase family 2 protein n=1 Tax=Cryobacterium ruanii TaxID=1259197 RepID=A0A4V3ITV4_9MICO|nr:glycosyltransferase family 2 protein [Cryobacterium ruanii]TFD69378.1 glycosyltransferase family 2 protein [Cryobacterium ruanii]